jgi:ribosomal protein L11 methyltransferase
LKWLEISITLTGELIEPVADVFQRVCSTGVAFTPGSTDETALSRASPITLRAYLPVDAQMNAKRRRIQRELSHLSMITPLPQAQFQVIEEQHWGEAWKAHYSPLPVGRRLQIVPSWLEAEAGERLVIRLDPGMAFGTGTHPSTQLCLEALEDNIRPGMLVADLGCGSGILSMAAALLGARKVLALDSDPEAVKIAEANVECNGLTSQVEVMHGSLPELRRRLEAAGARADITVANILAKVVIGMLDLSLAETVQDEGILILSGILDHQVEEVLEAGRREGLTSIGTPAIADWCALLLRKRPPR